MKKIIKYKSKKKNTYSKKIQKLNKEQTKDAVGTQTGLKWGWTDEESREDKDLNTGSDD